MNVFTTVPSIGHVVSFFAQVWSLLLNLLAASNPAAGMANQTGQAGDHRVKTTALRAFLMFVLIHVFVGQHTDRDVYGDKHQHK